LAGVQTLVVGAILAIFTTMAIMTASAVLDRRGSTPWLQVGLGLGVGLVGAFLVLVERTDLIPDGTEDGLERMTIILVTVVAVVASWVRLVRA
jgi:hypothetical protein